MSTVAEVPEQKTVPDAIVAVALLVGAEAMLFAGLVSALVVLRAGAGAWPPAGQLLLPRGLSAANVLVLLASGLFMLRALRAARAGRSPARDLGWAAALGALFVAVQGLEWVRLVRFGLGAAASVYASTFYGTIAVHGTHVLGGLVALAWVLARERRAPGWAAHNGRLAASGLYWGLVVLVWPVLYGLVYVR